MFSTGEEIKLWNFRSGLLLSGLPRGRLPFSQNRKSFSHKLLLYSDTEVSDRNEDLRYIGIGSKSPFNIFHCNYCFIAQVGAILCPILLYKLFISTAEAEAFLENLNIQVEKEFFFLHFLDYTETRIETK